MKKSKYINLVFIEKFKIKVEYGNKRNNMRLNREEISDQKVFSRVIMIAASYFQTS